MLQCQEQHTYPGTRLTPSVTAHKERERCCWLHKPCHAMPCHATPCHPIPSHLPFPGKLVAIARTSQGPRCARPSHQSPRQQRCRAGGCNEAPAATLTLIQLCPAQPQQPTLSTPCHCPSQFLAVTSLGCAGAPPALPLFALQHCSDSLQPCLQSHPASQHGSRLGQEAPASWPCLRCFRCSCPFPFPPASPHHFSDSGCLTPNLASSRSPS